MDSVHTAGKGPLVSPAKRLSLDRLPRQASPALKAEEAEADRSQRLDPGSVDHTLTSRSVADIRQVPFLFPV